MSTSRRDQKGMQAHDGILAINLSLSDPLYTTRAPPWHNPRVKITSMDRNFEDVVRLPCVLRRWEQDPAGRAAAARPLHHAIGLRVRVLPHQMLRRPADTRQHLRLPIRLPRHLPERPGGTARGPPIVRHGRRVSLGRHMRKDPHRGRCWGKATRA